MSSFKGKVAIIGIGEVPTGKFPERPCLQNGIEAARMAILDAGINKDEIDVVMPTGVFSDGVLNVQLVAGKMVEELGLQRKAKANLQVFSGGSSSSTMLMTACSLVAGGHARMVLCVQCDKVGTIPTQQMIDMFTFSGDPEWEDPYGFFAVANGGLVATRYMHETRTTAEQLASVVVSMRKWAALNPNAMLRRELTIDEILASKMIATPLTTKEANVFADGGAAFIVANAAIAMQVCRTPVYPLGFGSRVTHYSLSQCTNLLDLGYTESGKEAFEMAGINATDVDIVEFYDAYPVYPLLSLEGLGFCKKGEAGAFVQAGNTWPGGKLPMTTNGGMLGQGHTAAGGGIAILVEAVRQLMGKAGERQVKGARIAVETSHGGTFMDSHVCVLGTVLP